MTNVTRVSTRKIYILLIGGKHTQFPINPKYILYILVVIRDTSFTHTHISWGKKYLFSLYAKGTYNTHIALVREYLVVPK